MLFRKIYLDGIKAGHISLAFRYWQKPFVKEESLINTAVGVVRIKSVSSVKENSITESDAKNAGFESLKKLLDTFMPYRRKAENLYRLELEFYAEDPRIELREQSTLTDKEVADIKKKLDSFDRRSKAGAWTKVILLTVSKNPGMKAIEISRLTGFEKEWLKLNIRKLKNLGLTISHHVGYEISPLGKVFQEKLHNQKDEHA